MAEQSIYSKDKEKRLVKAEKYIESDRRFKYGVAGALGASSGGLWVYLKTTLGL